MVSSMLLNPYRKGRRETKQGWGQEGRKVCSAKAFHDFPLALMQSFQRNHRSLNTVRIYLQEDEGCSLALQIKKPTAGTIR